MEPKTPKGKVMSFYADDALIKKIKMEAVKLDRAPSFVMRLAIRKYFGLKETGSV